MRGQKDLARKYRTGAYDHRGKVRRISSFLPLSISNISISSPQRTRSINTEIHYHDDSSTKTGSRPHLRCTSRYLTDLTDNTHHQRASLPIEIRDQSPPAEREYMHIQKCTQICNPPSSKTPPSTSKCCLGSLLPHLQAACKPRALLHSKAPPPPRLSPIGGF